MPFWYYLRSKAGATPTRPCDGLWLVEGCGDTPPPATTRHMDELWHQNYPNVYTHKTFHGLVYTNFIIELL